MHETHYTRSLFWVLLHVCTCRITCINTCSRQETLCNACHSSRFIHVKNSSHEYRAVEWMHETLWMKRITQGLLSGPHFKYVRVLSHVSIPALPRGTRVNEKHIHETWWMKLITQVSFPGLISGSLFIYRHVFWYRVACRMPYLYRSFAHYRSL